MWFRSLSFLSILNCKMLILYSAARNFMLPCIEFQIFVLDEIKWQLNHVLWQEGPSNIWTGNLRAFGIQKLTSVKFRVHFSYNWSQSLPYVDILFCKYYSALFTIIPLNMTVEFNITARRTKTTSSCRMDFVREEKFSNGEVPQYHFVSTHPTTPTEQWNIDFSKRWG